MVDKMNPVTFSLVAALILGVWGWSTDAADCSIGHFVVWNVTISSQLEMNRFIANVTAYNDKNRSTTNCLHLSLAGGHGSNYEMDIVKLLNINVTDGNLIVKSVGGTAEINCTAHASDLEELREALQPLSRASLVLLDGLTFTGCPVPILIEKASNVVIQNCVFQ